MKWCLESIIRSGARLLVLLILPVLLHSPAHALDDLPDDYTFVPRCGGIYDLCGYAHRQDEHELIPKRYERVTMFSEGLAAVRIDGLFGYIDKTGKVVIEPRFDVAGPFHEGFAEILVGQKTGVIARNGDIVLQPQFKRSIPLNDDVILVQNGIYSSSMDTEFATLGTAFGLYGLPMSRGTWGLYRLGTGWLTADSYEFKPFGKSLWARDMSAENPLFGVMGIHGKWLVQPAFDAVQGLQEGRAVVSVNVGERQRPRLLSGAVDAEGKVVIPLRYDRLTFWAEGYAVAQVNGREGFLDPEGRLLGGRLFDKVERDRQRKPSKVQLDGQWFGISRDGSLGDVPVDVPEEERSALVGTFELPKPPKNTECDNDVSIVSRDGLWGLEGPDGRVLVEPRFEAISCFEKGVAWVPDLARRLWCPVGPDGKLRGKPDCRTTYYAVNFTEHYPEKLDPDPFRSSLLWMQAFLKHGLDPRHQPPRLMAVRYDMDAILVNCRERSPCE